MYFNEMVGIVETIRSVYEVYITILSFEIQQQGQRPEIYVYILLSARKDRYTTRNKEEFVSLPALLPTKTELTRAKLLTPPVAGFGADHEPTFLLPDKILIPTVKRWRLQLIVLNLGISL